MSNAIYENLTEIKESLEASAFDHRTLNPEVSVTLERQADSLQEAIDSLLKNEERINELEEEIEKLRAELDDVYSQAQSISANRR